MANVTACSEHLCWALALFLGAFTLLEAHFIALILAAFLVFGKR